MKNIKLFLSFCLLLAITISCIKKKETNTQEATGAASTAAPAQQKRQKIDQARVKNNQSKNERPKPVAIQPTKPLNSFFEQKKSKEVKDDFQKEISIALGMEDQKVKKIDELIKVYQKKGMEYKFFGKTIKYGKQTPFGKELNTFLSPLEYSKYGFFHAYWVNNVSKTPFDPVSLFYALNLDRKQLYDLIDLQSRTILELKKVTKNTPDFQQKRRIISQNRNKQLTSILTKDQLTRYGELVRSYIKSI